MNYQSETYTEVAALLRAMDGVRWTDLDRGQMQRQGQEHPTPMPAVLIGLGDVQWHTATGLQYGDMDLEVTVMVELGQETYHGAEGASEALGLLEWHDKVYEALEGKSGSCWTGMTRRATRKAEWGGGVVTMKSVWRCTVTQKRPSKEAEWKVVECRV